MNNDGMYGLLGPVDQRDAITQGLLGLGAGLLQASGPSAVPTSLGGAIGRGASQGFGAYQGAMNNSLNRNLTLADLHSRMQGRELVRAQTAQKIKDREEHQQRVKAYRESLDPSVRSLFDVNPEGFTNAVYEGMKGKDPIIKEIDGTLISINPNDNSITNLGTFTAPKEPKAPTTRTIYDDATGLRQTVQWNPQTSEWDKLGGVETPDGMSVSIGADGSVQLVQGPGGGKPLTEQQSKDAVYYTRAAGALETFEQVAGSMGSLFDRALNIDDTGILRQLQDDKFQVAQTAGREFLAAFLRKDTGAAITKAEMDEYGSIYLPALGDSEQVLAYKKEARQRALQAIKAGMAPQAIINAEMALRASRESDPDKTLSVDNSQVVPDEINAGGWGIKEIE
ncbi:hypothetical protein [Thalassospira sp.]|uniref:hypothetical protein n=1 Tax=Thalassospira sp. TaxID=1912094 RepID=UPI000C5ED3FC|nr:hypothetical protein [Thalassospira sp.]MAL41386.1 hypothetical protein [Thalassospira sp.]|tara:strand:+ start:3646 stop:4830 length:1185 start_codon:yes stop_codon:yes gene_type:complete